MKKSRRSLGMVLVLVGLTLVVALAFGLAGAFASSSSPAPSTDKVVLKIGWQTDPDNLNPFIGTEESAYEVWTLNYQFLFGFSSSDEPTPDIAAEIPTYNNGDISADGKVWTVHIRPGLKWNDGQPLTAEDVAYTYNLIIKNQLYAFFSMLDGINEVKVVDPTTVQIICTRPKADMLRLWVPILPEHIWGKMDAHEIQRVYRNKPPIVGSGPFKVVAFDKGNSLTLERNPYYFGKTPAVDEIVFLDYSSADAMTQELKAGTIDAAHGIPPGQFPSLSKTKGIAAIAYNYLNWDYMCMNCYTGGKSTGNPVLLDPAFRKALNYAIDQQQLIKIAFQGHATPGVGIMSPNSWTNPDYHWQPASDQLYGFDLEKAKAALEAAGYKDGNGDGIREDKSGKPITLRLWSRNESESSQVEGKLITGWLKDIGLKIEYSVIDNGTLEDRIWNYEGNTFVPDFDLYLWDWDGYADPGQTLACYTTSQIEGWNEPAWSNTEFDKLNTQQFAELDANKRADMVWKMQQIMYDQSPQITLTYPDYLQAYNTEKWTGWTRMFGGTGGAFYLAGDIDTYLNLEPVTVAKSSTNKTAIISAVIAVALCVAGLVWWLVARRKGKAVEEG